jgi:hypothetical protein
VYRFEPLDKKRVRYALGAVKGTGRAPSRPSWRRAKAEAGGGPFRSFFDFCARVDRKRVNKRAVEALIKAGAFDALHADRASLLASVGLAFEFADTRLANASQGGLFDFGATMRRRTQEPRWPGRAVEHQGAAAVREDGGGLLPVGPPVRAEPRRKCGASASGASPTWSTAASRSCWPASSASCASSTASAAAWPLQARRRSEAIEAVANQDTLDAGELDLGDQAKVYPSDAALLRLKELMPDAQATVVYGEG